MKRNRNLFVDTYALQSKICNAIMPEKGKKKTWFSWVKCGDTHEMGRCLPIPMQRKQSPWTTPLLLKTMEFNSTPRNHHSLSLHFVKPHASFIFFLIWTHTSNAFPFDHLTPHFYPNFHPSIFFLVQEKKQNKKQTEKPQA